MRRLEERLDAHLLINKDPTVVERHRTLAKAIDWSFELLDDDEKQAFLAMSVFRGGCTVDALAYVLGAEVDEALGSLLDKSLLQQTPGRDGEPRYRFSDPTREYAAARSIAQFEAGHLERRHCNYFSSIARDDRVNADARFSQIAADIDNTRAALDWSLRPGDADSAETTAFILAMVSYWRGRSWFTEARLWLDRARKMPTPASAELTRQAASFAAMQDDYDVATLLAQEALAAYTHADDVLGEGKAQHTLAEIAHREGRWDEAKHLYEEALVHLRSARHVLGTTTCLINLGLLARERQEFETAQALLNEAAAFAVELNNPNISAQLLIEQAWLALSEHRTEDGGRMFHQALEQKLAQSDLHGICQARLGVATAALLRDEATTAGTEFETSLREAQRLNARIFMSDALYGIAAANALQGRLEAAAQYYALAERRSAELRVVRRSGLAQSLADRRITGGLTAEERSLAVSIAPSRLASNRQAF